jgi:hypothetical protein
MTGTEETTGKIVEMHLHETSEREQVNGRLVLRLNVLRTTTFLRLVAVRSLLGFSLARLIISQQQQHPLLAKIA